MVHKEGEVHENCFTCFLADIKEHISDNPISAYQNSLIAIYKLKKLDLPQNLMASVERLESLLEGNAEKFEVEAQIEIATFDSLQHIFKKQKKVIDQTKGDKYFVGMKRSNRMVEGCLEFPYKIGVKA